MRLNYAVGFLTLVFLFMVLWLFLCGYCFTVGFLRSGFCGLFVSISFGDGDYAGGKLNAAAFVFVRSGQAKYRLVSCHF